jgi:hypothetical protein
MRLAGLRLVGEVDQLQTVFYLVLLIAVMLAAVLAFVAAGLRYVLPLARSGAHPAIAVMAAFTLLLILAFVLVGSWAVLQGIAAHHG